MKSLLTLSFLFLTFPTALYAEEQSLLPAICQQVLTPKADVSVPGIIVSHIVERAKALPSKIAADINNAIGGVANSLADTLEGQKSGGTVLAADAGNVLGTSTSAVGEQSLFDSIKDDALSVLIFLLRHWLVTLAALGGVAVALLLRF